MGNAYLGNLQMTDTAFRIIAWGISCVVALVVFAYLMDWLGDDDDN